MCRQPLGPLLTSGKGQTGAVMEELKIGDEFWCLASPGMHVHIIFACVGVH